MSRLQPTKDLLFFSKTARSGNKKNGGRPIRDISYPENQQLDLAGKVYSFTQSKSIKSCDKFCIPQPPPPVATPGIGPIGPPPEYAPPPAAVLPGIEGLFYMKLFSCLEDSMNDLNIPPVPLPAQAQAPLAAPDLVGWILQSCLGYRRIKETTRALGLYLKWNGERFQPATLGLAPGVPGGLLCAPTPAMGDAGG